MDILVIGTGGLAREFTSFFSSSINIIGFSSSDTVDFEKFGLPGILYGDDVRPETVGTEKCVIALGSPALKKKVVKNYKSRGFKFPNLVHESAIIGTKLPKFSEGIVISPGCVVGSNIQFGNHVYLNFMVGVGHDTSFKDFIQVNPGAQIGGASDISECVLIGSGSTIRQGLKVQQNSTIGAGSTVFNSVREGITVVGNPAKRLKFPVR